MAAEVRMVLYEDDSVQVRYADGSTLQLSPCGSEFLFEKAPALSTHPLEQPERIRQRTHFVISTYRVSNSTKTLFLIQREAARIGKVTTIPDFGHSELIFG